MHAKARFFGTLYLLALAAFFYFSQAHATDLNAPVVAKPTVKSEIVRGRSAGLDCGAQDTPSQLSTCLYNTGQRNKQNNTASLPFMTGMYFDGWQTAIISAKTARNFPTIDPTPWDRSVITMFTIFRDYQLQSGLSIQDLCNALNFKPGSCEKTAKEAAEWSAKTGK